MSWESDLIIFGVLNGNHMSRITSLEAVRLEMGFKPPT